MHASFCVVCLRGFFKRYVRRLRVKPAQDYNHGENPPQEPGLLKEGNHCAPPLTRALSSGGTNRWPSPRLTVDDWLQRCAPNQRSAELACKSSDTSSVTGCCT